MLLLWSSLAMPLVVFINAPKCSRSYLDENENKLRSGRFRACRKSVRLLSQVENCMTHVTQLAGDQECYFCQIFSMIINNFEAFISFLSKGLSSRGETTPVSNAYSCYYIILYDFTKRVKWRYVLPYKPANTCFLLSCIQYLLCHYPA